MQNKNKTLFQDLPKTILTLSLIVGIGAVMAILMYLYDIDKKETQKTYQSENCSAMADEWNKNGCYLDLAKKTNNNDLCDKITNYPFPDLRKGCYNSLAINKAISKNDQSLCREISDSYSRYSCQESFIKKLGLREFESKLSDVDNNAGDERITIIGNDGAAIGPKNQKLVVYSKSYGVYDFDFNNFEELSFDLKTKDIDGDNAQTFASRNGHNEVAALLQSLKN